MFLPLQNSRLAGGLYISPNDYAKWLFQYFLGNLAKADIVKAIETDNTPQPAVQQAYSPVSYAKPQRYAMIDCRGCLWFTWRVPGRVWHYCLGNWLECGSATFTVLAHPCCDRLGGSLISFVSSRPALMPPCTRARVCLACCRGLTAGAAIGASCRRTIRPTHSPSPAGVCVLANLLVLELQLTSLNADGVAQC